MEMFTPQSQGGDLFWVQITGSGVPYAGVVLYPWVEVLPKTGFVFFRAESGRNGSPYRNPVYDPNGSLLAPNGYYLVRRQHLDSALDWVYAVLYSLPAFIVPQPSLIQVDSSNNVVTFGPGGSFGGSSQSDTFSYTNDTFSYSGQNSFVIQNLTAYAQNNTVLQISAIGTGYLYITAPLEICGWQFWCCTGYTFLTSSVNNWVPPVAATVYDVIPVSIGTTLTGIYPQPVGGPINIGPVVGATNASPIVLTVGAWTAQPPVGTVIWVSGVNGNTAANGNWTVQASTATTVTLQNSTGNGAYAASPNSIVREAGAQLLVLNNIGTHNLVIPNSSGSSDPGARILLPPTYGSSVTLAPNDSITLWWDFCGTNNWRVLSCTVDVDVAPVSTQGYNIAYNTNLTNGVGLNIESIAAVDLHSYIAVCTVTFSLPAGADAAVIIYDNTAAADIARSHVANGRTTSDQYVVTVSGNWGGLNHDIQLRVIANFTSGTAVAVGFSHVSLRYL